MANATNEKKETKQEVKAPSYMAAFKETHAAKKAARAAKKAAKQKMNVKQIVTTISLCLTAAASAAGTTYAVMRGSKPVVRPCTPDLPTAPVPPQVETPVVNVPTETV